LHVLQFRNSLFYFWNILPEINLVGWPRSDPIYDSDYDEKYDDEYDEDLSDDDDSDEDSEYKTAQLLRKIERSEERLKMLKFWVLFLKIQKTFNQYIFGVFWAKIAEQRTI